MLMLSTDWVTQEYYFSNTDPPSVFFFFSSSSSPRCFVQVIQVSGRREGKRVKKEKVFGQMDMKTPVFGASAGQHMQKTSLF